MGKHISFFFTVCFLIIPFFSAFSQSKGIFNGDLEQADIQKKPVGWVFGFNGEQEKQYSSFLDSATKVNGRYSLCIAKIGKVGNYGVAYYNIPKSFQGKEITLKGYLKTEQVSGFAGLWLRLDGYNSTLAFDNMENKHISGTTDFKEYSITLPYDDTKALKIVTGALLQGSGKLWVDNMRLFIDGKPIDQAKQKIIRLLPAESDTSFASASRLDTVSLNDQKLINLTKLGQIWGFLKYYHPAVAQGAVNMDAELFRALPRVLQSKNNFELSTALENWVDNVNRLDTKVLPKTAIDTAIINSPEIDLILDRDIYSSSLVQKLSRIFSAHENPANFYVTIADNGTGAPVFTNEKSYASMAYPDAGYRLLCLFRYWNMIQYFYPDKHLTSKKWNTVLREEIPNFLQVSNKTEYVLAALKLIALINDTHANIFYNQILESYKGRFELPVQGKFIEGKLVVTEFYTDSARHSGQLKAGDAIKTINGESVEELVKKYLPFSPASNYTAQLRDMPKNFLFRSNDPVVKLLVESEGKEKAVNATAIEQMKVDHTIDINPAPQTPGYMLIGNIGYVFPGRYSNSDLPAIKKLFKNTIGIVVDMRCYPSDFMPFTFVPFIKAGTSKFAQFITGSVSAPGTFKKSFGAVAEGLGEYRGRVVVIVNEQTQSQAEYTTMAFQSSPNVTVIGSTTAGADGNICNISLPGGVNTYMSGIGVLYPDGTESQRKGVKIDIDVKPTIRGIASQKDELLEKALLLLKKSQPN